MSVESDLRELADPEKAKLLQGFFKTGKGEYAEGDIFLGVVVPEQRKVAQRYAGLTLPEIQTLLNSKIHEHRLTALFILTDKYQKSGEQEKKKIFELYLKNKKNINNWDLIDLSAPKIVGNYLLDKKRDILYRLAKSKSLWEKRMSILATFEFIANNEYKDTLAISEILLNGKHDLIHKGVGWMLREVGKRVSQEKEEEFLNKHYKKMPRTMLRYAIERFPEQKRKFYLKK